MLPALALLVYAHGERKGNFFIIFVSTSSNIIATLVPDAALLAMTDECYLRIDYTTRCDTDIYKNFIFPYAVVMIFVSSLLISFSAL